MFGSVVLETALGLVFVYTLLSLLCSAAKELVASLVGLRARTLEKGIGRLLADGQGDPVLRGFYDHPLVKTLGKERKKGNVRPSYIPSKVFSTALLDTVRTLAEKPAEKADEAAPSPLKSTAADLRDAITELPAGHTRDALLSLVDSAEGDLQQARKNVEEWFDNAMDRVTGWYNRSAQGIVLAAGILFVCVLDIDSIVMAKDLWRNPTVRQTVVASAQGFVEQNKDADAPKSESVEELNARLASLELPIGWTRVPTDAGGWVQKVVGLVISILGVSLGAPFWFDILKKMANLRSSGKIPERTAEAEAARG